MYRASYQLLEYITPSVTVEEMSKFQFHFLLLHICISIFKSVSWSHLPASPVQFGQQPGLTFGTPALNSLTASHILSSRTSLFSEALKSHCNLPFLGCALLIFSILTGQKCLCFLGFLSPVPEMQQCRWLQSNGMRPWHFVYGWFYITVALWEGYKREQELTNLKYFLKFQDKYLIFIDEASLGCFHEDEFLFFKSK